MDLDIKAVQQTKIPFVLKRIMIERYYWGRCSQMHSFVQCPTASRLDNHRRAALVYRVRKVKFMRFSQVSRFSLVKSLFYDLVILILIP